MSQHDDGCSQNIFSQYDLGAGISRMLSSGVKAQVFHGEQSTMLIARFGPNMRGRIHKHPHEQWHFVLEGSCTRIHEGEEVACKQGDFWVTLGGTMHTVIAGDEGLVLLDFFAPMREDYKESGEGFGNSTYQSDS